MAPAPLSWLNKNAIGHFTARGAMDTYEKDLHEAGEKLVLRVVERLLQDRRVDQDDFIVNFDKRMIKHSSLDISSSTDRKLFEFHMLDNDRTERSYVGERFTLVRGRNGENEEDRKRNISDEYKRVLRGLYIWNKLRESSYFAPLIHISLDDGKSITAVSEMFHRDVRQCLSTPGIEFATIIKGIAKALNFLHKFTQVVPDVNEGGSCAEKFTGIVHGDVKCVNVLLREGSSIPYLTSFGISREVIEDTFIKMLDTSDLYAIGTLPWMAPELFLVPGNKSKVISTTESDVWSFGMTIYEIVSSGDPWAQDVTKGLHEAADIQGKVKEAMNRKYLPYWPATIPQPLQKYSDSLRNLHNQCCKYVPGERITMEEVIERLDEIFM